MTPKLSGKVAAPSMPKFDRRAVELEVLAEMIVEKWDGKFDKKHMMSTLNEAWKTLSPPEWIKLTQSILSKLRGDADHEMRLLPAAIEITQFLVEKSLGDRVRARSKAANALVIMVSGLEPKFTNEAR